MRFYLSFTYRGPQWIIVYMVNSKMDGAITGGAAKSCPQSTNHRQPVIVCVLFIVCDAKLGGPLIASFAKKGTKILVIHRQLIDFLDVDKIRAYFIMEKSGSFFNILRET